MTSSFTTRPSWPSSQSTRKSTAQLRPRKAMPRPTPSTKTTTTSKLWTTSPDSETARNSTLVPWPEHPILPTTTANRITPSASPSLRRTSRSPPTPSNTKSRTTFQSLKPQLSLDPRNWVLNRTRKSTPLQSWPTKRQRKSSRRKDSSTMSRVSISTNKSRKSKRVKPWKTQGRKSNPPRKNAPTTTKKPVSGSKRPKLTRPAQKANKKNPVTHLKKKRNKFR